MDKPKPLGKHVRVFGEPIWSTAKVVSNISTPVPNLQLWAWAVKVARRESVVPIKGDVFCTPESAQIRLKALARAAVSDFVAT